MKGENNICVISVWFGQWPDYVNIFLKTCASNQAIDWHIVSDQEYPAIPSGNISFRHLSEQEFIDSASEKLGFEISLKDPYKLCDFKPAFGEIFEDLLPAYQYWGYCDMDIVFGEILEFVSPLLEGKPDIVSGYPDFLSGPFCLYRNAPAINKLYRDCPDHITLLQDPIHKAFDENIPRDIKFVRKNFYRLQYLMRFMVSGPRYFFRIREIRYHFQWYAKKFMSYKSTPKDMTDLVLKAGHENKISAIFKDLIKSDRAWERQGRKSWTVTWEKGKLKDTSKGEDLFAFHFIEGKSRTGFVIRSQAISDDKFIVSRHKIEYG